MTVTTAGEQRTRSRRGVARRALTCLGVLLLTLTAAGPAYQRVATAVDAHRYPPPGRLVDVGGYRLHIYCTGSGRPTVVLDALFPGTVSNWAWVQPRIARTTRVCAYDRAGLGRSDCGPTPRDARQHARELQALLTRAQIPGPYVLVGHSLGGLSVRVFAAEHPSEVAGMALVEASDPDAWARLGQPEGVGVDHRELTAAPVLGGFGVFRLGLVHSYPPDPDLPAQQRAELQAFYDSVKSLDTIRDVDASFPPPSTRCATRTASATRPWSSSSAPRATAGTRPARPVRPAGSALDRRAFSASSRAPPMPGWSTTPTPPAPPARPSSRSSTPCAPDAG